MTNYTGFPRIVLILALKVYCFRSLSVQSEAIAGHPNSESNFFFFSLILFCFL